MVSNLESELRRAVRGEVRFDAGTRAIYAADASNYRFPPIGVVLPLDREDVIAAVAVCHRFGAPLLPRGGGTSIAGQCCNTAVVLDMTRHFNRVLSLDPVARTATVEPGIVLDELQKAAAPHGLIFGPNPATHSRCALGGMIGNNSCGLNSVHAAFYGPGPRTSDNVHRLEVLTYDGEILQVGPTDEGQWASGEARGGRAGQIYRDLRKLRDTYADQVRQRYPKIPRRVSGYNLDDLLPEKGGNIARALAGSEGTCVVYLSATVELIANPKHRAVLALGYEDAPTAGGEVMRILPFKPTGLEGIDRELVENMRDHHAHAEAIRSLPKGGGFLLVEFGGEDTTDCERQAAQVIEAVKKSGKLVDLKLFSDPEGQKRIWEAREAGLGATAFVPSKKDTWEGWEDSAVPPEKVGEYLVEFKQLLERFGYGRTALYGHYGQGCIHCRMEFDLYNEPGIANYRAFVDEAADLVVKFGGSLSGEHGDGQSRAELLPKMYGPELVRAFQEYKAIWDPDAKMNPGKVVRPNPIVSHLRLGSNYNPWRPPTHFQYPDDHGDFSRAVLRCVGVGECRKHEGGTMCPSYMVTRQEEHSTRGRAHLLFEMLNGSLVKDGFRNEQVHEALDLCLACKGCRGECPVHVDVATYKAEFLSHYYEDRPRPLRAYAFGLIGRWARFGAAMPRLSNFFLRAPGLSSAMKGILGVASRRKMPVFAAQSFKSWFFSRPPADPSGPRVILWPDTFNNYYHPQVARAAVEFLEGGGWHVVVPRPALCCGRPLYDYGMLAEAKKWLLQIVDHLRSDIRAGVPLIGLEPSCATVFRDELKNLFPHDNDALRLSQQTYLLSEFIEKKMPGVLLPQLQRKAVVHGHCHHKAIMKMTDEIAVLKRMGVDFEEIDSGCCGMAGAFGFEKDHYEVSVQCGERVLLPKVRATPPDAVLIADGFSCKEQISQCTGRTALHLAEVIALARGTKA